MKLVKKEARFDSGIFDELFPIHESGDDEKPVFSPEIVERIEFKHIGNIGGKTAQPVRMVFILQCKSSGDIKIGSTRHVAERLQKLRAESDCGFVSLGMFQTVGTDFEDYIRRKFQAQNTFGKWFKPTDEMLAFFEELKAMEKSSVARKVAAIRSAIQARIEARNSR